MAAHSAHMRHVPAPEPQVRPMPRWELPVAGIVLFLSSWAISIDAANALVPDAALRVILFLGGLFCYRRLRSKPFALTRGETIGLAIFCALLSVVLLLGGHIHFSGEDYHGNQYENYITAYQPADWLTLVLQLPILWVLVTSAYQAIVRRETRPAATGHLFSPARVDRRTVLVLAAIFFACWFPYLLAYWPGYIFGDSIRSLNQCFAGEPLNNHDPILYTLYIGLCLNIGQAIFGSHTAGVAIYSISQMVMMAICLAYLTTWIVSHLRLKRWWFLAFALLFAGTPYVANYSIAMWKDPLFSCALVMLTLCLANLLIDLEQGCRRARPWSLGLCTLALCFTRNNGLFVGLVAAACLAIVLLRARAIRLRPRPSADPAALPLAFLLGAIVVGYVVTGPIFSAAGFNSESTVESSGLMVSQMARVPATGGVMSRSDRNYLNRLYPLRRYAEDYPPSCIDSLKWSPDFDPSVLDDDLVGHWLSLGTKNPLTYFEAWELQTAGFWSLGYVGMSYYNIALGAPVNLQEEEQDPGERASTGGAGDEDSWEDEGRDDEEASAGEEGEETAPSAAPSGTNPAVSYDRPTTAREISQRYGIDIQSILPKDVRRVLVSDEWSVPAGWILWLLVFSAICLVGGKRSPWLLVLMPSLALMATLVLASPIIYWPRYTLACQLLLPFYLALLARLRSVKEK